MQENCSATWFANFMVMGCLSPIILTQSPSWWCMPCPAKMDAIEEDSERQLDMWCHFLTFPEFSWLVVAY